MQQNQIFHATTFDDPVCYASMTPGQTAINLGVSAAYSATAAAFVFKNTDSDTVGGRYAFLREIHFTLAVAPASGTGLLYATALDSTDRTPTGVVAIGSPTTASATLFTAKPTNMSVPASNCAGQWWFPNSTAGGAPPAVPAAGANVRQIRAGNLRSVIPVAAASSGVQDDYTIVFDDTGLMASGASSTAGAMDIVERHPPVAIGPGQFFLLYLWSPSNAATGMAFAQVDMTWREGRLV